MAFARKMEFEDNVMTLALRSPLFSFTAWTSELASVYHRLASARAPLPNFSASLLLLFLPFPQPPKPPVSHTFHISQVYWPWKRLITCHMILIRHSLFKYLQDSCVRFYPNSRILSCWSSFVCFERSTSRDKWEQLRIYTFKWRHVYMNDAYIYDPCSLTLMYVSVIHISTMHE